MTQGPGLNMEISMDGNCGLPIFGIQTRWPTFEKCGS